LYQQGLAALEVLVVRLLLWFLVDLTVLEALVDQLIQLGLEVLVVLWLLYYQWFL
jgi:hypothetical protein